MPLYLKLLALFFSLIFTIVFVVLVRNKGFKPFYSALWFVIALFMMSVVIFEKFYKWIATTLQISDASFLVIIGILGFLISYVLYLSLKISEMSDRIQELISSLSILENKIRKIDNDKIN